MHVRVQTHGRIVGGVLDPSIDQSYYTLIPCAVHGEEVTLGDHRSCKNFGGLHLDADTGAYFVHCCRED